MKTNLPDNYIISVKDMIDIGLEYAVNGWEISTSEFFNESGEPVYKKILVKDSDEDCRGQIFAMENGTFILENDLPGMVVYYVSEDINELRWPMKKKKENMKPYDIIDKFCLGSEETDVLKFKASFLQMCKKENISEADFYKYKEWYEEFLIDNPTFGFDIEGLDTRRILLGISNLK
jgi:hypothetical protein